MLASTFLDTAIGIIFVFLLLSIIASTVNEIILSFLNLRGRMLLDGIKCLLSSKNFGGLVSAIYNHGQIFGLFKEPFAPTESWKDLFSKKTKRNLPSYIPSSNFAMAFLGVLPDAAQKAAELAQQAANDAKNAVATKTSAEDVAKAQEAANDAAKKAADAEAAAAGAKAALDKLRTVSPALSPADRAAHLVDAFATLRGVAQALSDVAETEKVGKPLLTMLDTCGNDFTKLQSNIEAWYNSAMDRVAGWYKYRTQWVLFWIGLVLAIALNANTVTIIKQISTNDTLRQSIVAAATKAKNPEQQHSPQATSTQTQSPPAQPAGDPPDQAKTPADGGASTDSLTNVQNQYQQLAGEVSSVRGLGLPIGWGNCAVPTGWSPFHKAEKLSTGDLDCIGGYNGSGELQNRGYEGWFALWGWLLTAIAVSLGAPFWFDLLNKFMVVRSTVKPREKSEDEGSKDKAK